MIRIPALIILLCGCFTASATTVYSTIPDVLPPNVSSVAYEATSTSEFGNAIQLAPGLRELTTITVVMSNWAKESTYETAGTSSGYSHPLTLSLYGLGSGGTVGAQFASLTIDAFLPWRPETPAACGTKDGWQAANGTCYGGIAVPVTFDFSGLNITLPDAFIFGLAYNTRDYGYAPLHAEGGFNSLNFGASGNPSVGSNLYSDGAYLNSSWSGMYGDGGAGGTGTFRLDPAGWGGYSPVIRIDVKDPAAAPEPSTFGIMGAVLACAAVRVRRKMTRLD